MFRENIAQLVTLLVVGRRIEPTDIPKVQLCIPVTCKDVFSKEEWEQVINKYFFTFVKMDETQLKRKFIDMMKLWKTYGSAFFKVQTCNDARLSGGCVIACSVTGIKMLHKTTRKLIEEFTYENIMNFRHDENEFVIRGTSSVTGNPKVALRFETKQGLVISDLLNSFIQYQIKLSSNNAGTNYKDVNQFF